MNSANAASGLLPTGAANIATDGQQTMSRVSAKSSDNSLKNNSFSNAMKRQSEAESNPEQSSSKTPTSAEKSAPATEKAKTFTDKAVTEGGTVTESGGNSLPPEGSPLPSISLDILFADAPLQGEPSVLPAEAVIPALLSDTDGAMAEIAIDAPLLGTDATMSTVQGQASAVLKPVIEKTGVAASDQQRVAVGKPLNVQQALTSTESANNVTTDKNFQALNSATLPVNTQTTIERGTAQSKSFKSSSELLTVSKKSALPTMVKELSSQLTVMPQSASEALQATATYSADLSQGNESAMGQSALLRSDIAALSRAEPAALTAAIEVGKPGWGENVVKQVMWMSSQQLNQANIALDPPELGPLQIQISTQHDQTSVVFTSHSSGVREALDQGATRLREMMEEQGLDLLDVNVSDQSQSREQAQREEESAGTDLAMNTSSSQLETEQKQDQPTLIRVASIGLVDDYA